VVIEWGRPFVERVVDQWLDVDIHTPVEDSDDTDVPSDSGDRVVTVTAHSRQGVDTRFAPLLEELNDFGH